MRSLQAVLLLLFAGVSLPAFADPLYDFTLTGEGDTLQFSSGNPPTVVEYPLGATDVGANDPAGSVNGVSGYDISAMFVAYGFFTPTFTLNVSPLPSGFPPPSSTHPAEFSLIGPDVLTLVSDKPNPAPCSTTAFCPNDLLTFDFAPAVYSFVGFGPASVYGNFSLDITQETPTGLTPEPGSWVLLLTGLAGLAWRHSARLPTPRRRTRAAAA